MEVANPKPMALPEPGTLVVREARADDVPALDALRPRGALHRDRVGIADPTRFRYLLAVAEGVVGSVIVYFKSEPGWDRPGQTPLLLDLWVTESMRGRGIGRRLIEAVEESCRAMGHRQLYISVEPRENPRAFALYQRLGYVPSQSQPYEDRYRFVDSAGNVEEGVEWCVDMRKELA